MSILVTIPFYNNNDTIDRTLRSLTSQFYRDFEILIVNDGGEPLESRYLGARQIKYFELEQNHGRYFIDAIAVQANPHAFYLPHDADDTSDLDRLGKLMRRQKRFDFDAVLHDQYLINRSGQRILEKHKDPELTPTMRHIAHHSGLYKTQALRDIGGYHPDFRVGYDTLLVNLMLMRHRVSILDNVLYTRYLRENSLTVAPETSRNSPLRKRAILKLNELYFKCYNDSANIKQIVEDSIDPKTKEVADIETERLKKLWL